MTQIVKLVHIPFLITILITTSSSFTSAAANSTLTNALDKIAEQCSLSLSQVDKYKNLDISKSVVTLTPQQTDALHTFQQKLQAPLKAICDPGNPQKPNPRRRLGTFGFDSLKSIVMTPCMASVQGITASIALECFAIGGFMDMATIEKLFPVFTFSCLEGNFGYAAATSVVTCLFGSGNSLESGAGDDPGQDPPPGSEIIPPCDIGGGGENDVCSVDSDQLQDMPDNSNTSNATTWDPKASERRRRLAFKNRNKPPVTFELPPGQNECTFKRIPGDESKWSKLAGDLDNAISRSARPFLNWGQRPKLPLLAPEDTYEETDVYPTGCGFHVQNRGKNRLVKNKSGDIYFTPDHYKTFYKLRVKSAGEYVLSKI